MTHSCTKANNGRIRRDPYSGPVTLPAPPTPQEIARLAYTYWEARGHTHGFHEHDWYQAERELQRRRNALAWG